ncbi:MAG TPA: hypothetical protein VGK86_00030 [Thermoanaerobaculia bacterium]
MKPVAGADSETQPRPTEPVAGLTNARVLALDRMPIRTRESGVTLSGWRLSADSDQGEGAIVLVEAGAGEAWYRGEGVFLGWTAENLRAAYEALRPRTEESAFEIQQLG